MFLVILYFEPSLHILSWSFSSSSLLWSSRCCCVVRFSWPANSVREQFMENGTWSQYWKWLMPCCVCLGLSPCAVSGELPLVFSAEGNKRPALLEKFLALWARTPSPPLHLLFSELTLTAIFSATDSEVNLGGVDAVLLLHSVHILLFLWFNSVILIYFFFKFIYLKK